MFMSWVLNRSIPQKEFILNCDMDEGYVAKYLSTHGKNLTTVGFSESNASSLKVKRMLKSAMEYCPNIVRLVCSRGFGVADHKAMALAWPKLEEVSLPSGSQGEYIMAFAQHCPCLSSLSVMGRASTLGTRWPDAIEIIGVRLLHLTTFTPISHNALETLVEHCRNLRSLRGDLAGIDDTSLSLIADGCPLLEALELPERYSPASGLLAVCRNGRLQELKVRHIPAAYLQHCPQMRKLWLWCGHLNTPATLSPAGRARFTRRLSRL
jgi:hypothetical protein